MADGDDGFLWQAWHQPNQLEFRLVDDTGYQMSIPGIEPVIDGQGLIELVRARASIDGVVSYSAEVVLSPGHTPWLGEPFLWANEVPAPRVPLLNCGCGNPGCGGVDALAEWRGDRVGWLDLHPEARIGPFVFERAAFTSSVLDIQARWRAEWAARSGR